MLAAAAAAATIAIVAVLARLFVRGRALVRANEALAQAATRQRMLADAAIGLARWDTIESVSGVVVRAAVALANDPRFWSAFVVRNPTGPPTVLAVAGPAPLQAGEPVGTDPVAVDEGARGARERPVADERATRNPLSREHCVVSVAAEGQTDGDLVLSDLVAADVEASLEAIRLVCCQGGLALRNAEAAQDRLDRSERKFRSLVQNSSDAVTLLGPDGVILYQSAGGASSGYVLTNCSARHSCR